MFNTSTCRNVSLVHIRFQSETTSFLVYNLKTCLLSSRTPCSQHATVPGDSASLPSFLANCDSINLKNFFFFPFKPHKNYLGRWNAECCSANDGVQEQLAAGARLPAPGTRRRLARTCPPPPSAGLHAARHDHSE